MAVEVKFKYEAPARGLPIVAVVYLGSIPPGSAAVPATGESLNDTIA